MSLHSAYMNVIGGRGGLAASITRGLLSILSVPYGLAVERRNRAFDSGKREIVMLPVPVISVGNITTGGTGKTPLVMDIVQRILDRNRRPAIVSRGYKSAAGEMGDELTMISRRLPGVPCVANPDRAAGARRAISGGTDVIVLDDAFQHRRIHRDLNILVIDATNPFGFDHLLPRGLLREPPSAASRADLMVVSRADLVAEAERDSLIARLKASTPAPITRCVHRPGGLFDLRGAGIGESPASAALFAAIGNPAAFEQTIAGMGIDVVQKRWWPDHHAYDQRDIEVLTRMCRDAGAVDSLITTEKDAVKLDQLDTAKLPPIIVLRIDVAYPEDGGDRIDAALDQVLESHTNG